ncbi:hypothetical protein HMH01_12375 [Halovulum dunhuangense]|uniref:Uncharacterized protein n=1 Tax=Halovulum dunhuangense TaxID=1505036 RepID=A0A849L4W7_9RHOB|nr:hypothetical protein [Halovulum dunhuangense]NNU81232.1 hypothetical protein [Halovulum dunhuangense]
MDKADQAREQEEAERRRALVSAQFFEWIEESREIVGVNFEELSAEDQAFLSVNLATSLMLTHKLGEIEARLGSIRQELNAKEPN